MKLGVIALVLLPWLAVVAGQGSSISGAVRDATTNEALIGATVSVADAGGVVGGGTVTDEDGLFTVTAAVGQELVFSYIGYRPQRRAVEAGDTDDNVDVFLRVDGQNLDEVVVTVSQVIADQFRVEKIDQLDVYTNPLAKADPLLAVAAGAFSTTTDESASISLRGSAASASGIFFEGVPLYGAVRFAQLDGIGTFSIFNTAMIDNVQVYPANPPLEFGNTAAGLVSIQATDNIDPTRVTALTLSLAGIGLTASGAINDRVGWLAFGSYQPSGMLKAVNPSALERLPGFRSHDMGGYVYGKPDSLSSLKVFHYRTGEDYRFDARPAAGPVTFGQERQRHSTVLAYRRQLGQRTFVLARGGYTRDDLSIEGGNLNVLTEERALYGSLAGRYVGNRWSGQLGISADDRRLDYTGYIPANFYAPREQDPSFDITSQDHLPLYEAYSFFNYDWSSRLQIGAGLRRNLETDAAEGFTSAQLYGTYRPSANQRWLLAAGRYRRLNPIGQAEPGEDRIESKQLTADYERRTGRFVLRGALYQKWEEWSDRSVTIRGMEAGSVYQRVGKFRGEISLTLLDVSEEIKGEEAPSEMNIPVFIRGSLQYQFGIGWTAGLSTVYRSGSLYLPVISATYDPELMVYEPTPAGNDQATRLRDYLLINANLSKIIPVGERLSAIAFISLNNVPGRHNESGPLYSADYSTVRFDGYSQRLFFAGVVLNFFGK